MLDSSDMQLLIFSDKMEYVQGETPYITAQIINRSGETAYFLRWCVYQPPALEVWIKGPDDSEAIERLQQREWQTNYRRDHVGSFHTRVEPFAPESTVDLHPGLHQRPEIFDTPGIYEISIVYSNELPEYDEWVDAAKTTKKIFVYLGEEASGGTWIDADADEFAEAPYEPAEHFAATSLDEKGPWIGEDDLRRRATLRELIEGAPRVTLKSKVLTIRIVGPQEESGAFETTAAPESPRDFLLPPKRFGRPEYREAVQKLRALGPRAYAELEALFDESSDPDERAYLLQLFIAVPGDMETPLRLASDVIANQSTDQAPGETDPPDVAIAQQVLEHFGAPAPSPSSSIPN